MGVLGSLVKLEHRVNKYIIYGVLGSLAKLE